MELLPLWLCLGFHLIAMEWKLRSGMAEAAFQGPCKLVGGLADCQGQDLASVPSHLPPASQVLVLDDNPLKTLWNGSLRPYPLLETLSLQSCRLDRVGSSAFQAQGRLLSLGLADNRLAEHYRETAAALRALRRLRRLDLSGNSLTEDMAALLLHNLSSLEAVSLARNALMRLDEAAFEGLGRLRELDLQRNLIFEIEGGAWGGLAELRALNLAHNHLPCVVGFSLRRLRTLNLSSNALEWFLAAGGDAPFELELLDLSHNRLLFFPQLPPRSRLRTLLLRDNRVAFYRPLLRAAAAPGDLAARFLLARGNATAVATVRLWDEFSGDLSALRELDLGQNQLRHLPAGLLGRSPRLARLDLSRNCLSALRLGRAEPLRALAELDLSHNRLAELRVAPGAAGRLRSLRSANLRANRLRALPAGLFARAARLAAVDLSRNPISLCPPPPPPRDAAGPPGCVDLRNLASLRSLSLEGCGLRALPGRSLRGTRLTHLDLSGNPGLLNGSLAPLHDVAPTLQVLSLRDVGLGSGAPDLDLAGFRKLRALDLSGNSLSRFPRLRAGEALRTLDLRRNALTALPPRAAARRLLQGLQTVYLSDNPYDCCGVGAWGGLEHLTSVADLAVVTCNLSSKVLRVIELPAGTLQDCEWEQVPAGLLSLVLVLPSCLTLLVAGAVVFLTFKKPLLQVIKSRCHWSSDY